MKKALITGITGQTGSYLAEYLNSLGYEVHGIVRRASLFNTDRIDHVFNNEELRKNLHNGDLQDGSSIQQIIDLVCPDEIYHLGAQSHVRVSFDMPEYTFDVNAGGTLRILECIRRHQDRTKKQIKLYNASSSEQFGNSPPKQSETTPFQPCSPYAVSKVSAYHLIENYKKSYGLFACSGILFNHESSRRGETFVTRKITRALGRINQGLQDYLYLGNLEAKRDWGFAGDYCKAQHLMLQQDKPDNYVIASGESYSVREFCELAFSLLHMDYKEYVRFDPRYLRPSEVDHLEGDSSKAMDKLGWKPTTNFEELVKSMVDHDLALAKQEVILKKEGYNRKIRG